MASPATWRTSRTLGGGNRRRADGAVGKQYLVAVDIGESGQPSSIFLGGHYEDVYAKTPEGWRFKTRTFIASATGAEAK